MEDNMEQLQYPVGRYIKPASFTQQQKDEWIGVLTGLPSWLELSIENLDEQQLQTPYRPGGWTITQVVHHLADSHMNAYIRLKLTLTEDSPVIKPYIENLWAELPDARQMPVNVSITLLHALHRRWVYALQHMQDADWERTYYHPEQKKNVPLWEMTGLYAWHSRHHAAHIRQLRERMNW